MGTEKEEAKQATPELDQYRAEIDALKAQLAQQQEETAKYQRSQQITVQYSSLKGRARSLVESGKMTPVAYKAMFEGKEDEAIARFSASDNTELTKFEAQIEYLEQFGQRIVQFGSLLSDEPLPDNGNADKDDFEWYKPKATAK